MLRMFIGLLLYTYRIDIQVYIGAHTYIYIYIYVVIDNSTNFIVDTYIIAHVSRDGSNKRDILNSIRINVVVQNVFESFSFFVSCRFI